MYCNSGWAGRGQTKAVLIYYPSLGKTINYGEIDAGHVKVRVGQRVNKGTYIGRAGHCGMLHFEVYSGRRSSNLRWMRGRARPSAIQDPRPLVKSVTGKFC